jgi:hypothetical protein
MGDNATYGYKASTYVAVGGVTTNQMRASVIEPTKYNAWIYLFTSRVGKAYSSNPTAQVDHAIYKASGVNATDFVGEGGTPANVTALMVNAKGGVDVSTKPSAPIMRHANQAYALVIRSNSNHFNFGMNASGQRMGFRTNASFPDPYGATSNNPNGRIGIWASEVKNTPPHKPSNVLPAEDTTTPDATPDMAADFRDDEESLPGFAIGTADRVKKYQFKILDSVGVVAKNSGVLTADSTMRSNRRVTWTPTGDLTGGDYTGWCQLYDEFEEKSEVKTWSFSIAATRVVVGIDPAHIDIAEPLRTVTDGPGLAIEWHDDSGSASMTNFQVRVRDEETGNIIRDPQSYAYALADGASGIISRASMFYVGGWDDLALGKRYRYEVQGFDGTSWSGWNAGPWFIVNFPPYAPSSLSPANGRGSTTIPALSAYFADADDESEVLTPEFYVREAGDPGSGVMVAATPYYLGNGRWGAQPDSSEIDHKGDWEWRARAQDPVGEFGSYQFWASFSYVDPPDIVITAPDPVGSDVTTSTPTATWTVDRTQVAYRVRTYKLAWSSYLVGKIIESLGGPTYVLPDPIDDTAYVQSSSGTYTWPGNLLVNDTDYLFELSIRTSDSLETVVPWGFQVDFVERPALTGFVGEAVQGPYEPSAAWASTIELNWDALPETEVSGQPWAADEDFGGYIVRRTNLDTGETERSERLPGRNLNGYFDREAASGYNYRWSVTYLYLQEGQWVESEPVEFEHALFLKGLVLTDMQSGVSVPVIWWDSRSIPKVFGSEAIVTLGKQPILFQGELNYRALSVAFHTVDDPGGAFTALDHFEAIESMADAVYTTPDGYPAPRDICLRTPSRLVLYGSLQSPLGREDDHDTGQVHGTLNFIQGSTYVEDDD